MTTHKKLIGYMNEPNPHNSDLIDVYRIYRETDGTRSYEKPSYWQTIKVDEMGRVTVWKGNRIKMAEGWESVELLQNGEVILAY